MKRPAKPNFTFADLFCGGGFGARGVVAAGGRPLLAVDAWDVAAKTYKANFPDAHVIHGRVEDVNPDVLRRRKVDLLLTSPECTNHTHARGSRPTVEASRETAMSTLVWTAALRPEFVVIENVPNMRGWRRYEELLSGLRSLDYGVTESIVCASDFGVPQRRRRLFLTAWRNGVPKKVRIPRVDRSPARRILDPKGTWDESPLYVPRRAKRTIAYAEAAMESLGGTKPFLVVYYGSDQAGGWQSLDQPLRTVTTLDRFALVRFSQGEWLMRMLQPGELARAMGVPMKHKFPVGNRRDKVRLCGNGICAPVVRGVVSQLLAQRRALSGK